MESPPSTSMALRSHRCVALSSVAGIITVSWVLYGINGFVKIFQF